LLDSKGDDLEAKRVWARQMRLVFSNYVPKIKDDPPIYGEPMIKPDGSLNKPYFEPTLEDIKKVALEIEGKRKNKTTERARLVAGIAKHGCGKWHEIQVEFLPEIEKSADIQMLAKRLLGAQSLKRYNGWKGALADIESEYEKNKAIGLKFNQWKGNQLVYDTAGLVARELGLLADDLNDD